MTTSNESVGSAARSMWREAGVQFRSNVLTPASPAVALHAHSYDHVLFLTQGIVDILPQGARVTAPYRCLVPAGDPHAITLAPECRLAEVLCLWASARLPDTEGC